LEQVYQQLNQLAIELGQAGRTAEQREVEAQARTVIGAAAQALEEDRGSEARGFVARARAIEYLARSCEDYAQAASQYREAARWFRLSGRPEADRMDARFRSLVSQIESIVRDGGDCNNVRFDTRAASVSPARPSDTSGASASAGTSKTGAAGPPPLTAADFDCTHKRAVDGASWDAMCLPWGGPQTRSRYIPPIPPEALFRAALEMCRTRPGEQQADCIMVTKIAILMDRDPAIRARCAGQSGDALIACVDVAYVYGPEAPAGRLRTQLKEALALRALAAYRERRAEAIAPAQRDAPAAGASPRASGGCAPGFGLKPTPGGFGGTSCQPLGGFAPPAGPGASGRSPAAGSVGSSDPTGGGAGGGRAGNPGGGSGSVTAGSSGGDGFDAEPPLPGIELSGVGAFRDSEGIGRDGATDGSPLNLQPGSPVGAATAMSKEAAAADVDAKAEFSDTLVDAAVNAVAALGAGLPEDERRTCMEIAYLATRDAAGQPPGAAPLADGAPAGSPVIVPTACAAIVDAARQNLSYYAAVRIDTRPERASNDDVLAAYLDVIDPKTGRRNSGVFEGDAFIGLEPTPEHRREMEILLNGGPPPGAETYGPPIPE
jgi:hypothetical protein